jgi:cobalt-zinc-cadmium efflux system membrane fusion protein
MIFSRGTHLRILATLVAVVVIGVGLVAAFPVVSDLFQKNKNKDAEKEDKPEPAVLIHQGTEGYGLRLTPEAVAGLELTVQEAKEASEPRPLPPQIGTINYDNERLFILQSRFPGEVAVIKQVKEISGPPTKFQERSLRYGDRLQQDELLAIVWSKDLGTQKAALVDAMCALNLSQNQLKRYAKLFQDGALPEAVYRAQERQVQADSGAVLTAKRTLKMWKLNDQEIADIEAEAKKIIDLKQIRDPDVEKKWAEVYMKVPRFSKDPNTKLVVVEKNVNLGQMVDPTTIIFKLADLSRLQIWVHPPEEYLPLLRERLHKGAKLKWHIQIQADPPGTKPMELPILQIAPSLDPYLHTPMVIGYLPNKDNKYLIGQFVTATIFVEPAPDTVQIPTDALNEVEGESLVFVQPDVKKPEYILKRVAVDSRFKDVSFVRSKLTETDRKLSEAEKARGRRPLQPLMADERVVTRGIVEMTAALDTQLAKHRLEKQQK